jgi:hypothetical protein
MKNLKLIALSALAFVTIASTVFVSCQKQQELIPSVTKIKTLTAKPNSKSRYKIYVVGPDKTAVVDMGHYYTYSGSDGIVHWDCSVSSGVCHVTITPGGYNSKNSTWVSNEDFDALEIDKVGVGSEIYSANVVNGKYRVTGGFTFAIFNEKTNETIHYDVPVGNYEVVENDTRFAIVFNNKN